MYLKKGLNEIIFKLYEMKDQKYCIHLENMFYDSQCQKYIVYKIDLIYYQGTISIW